MSKDSKFRTIAGTRGDEPDVRLGLELITQFQLLSHENKLKVMQVVNQLASTRQQDAT
jgi:hypothetical protein